MARSPKSHQRLPAEQEVFPNILIVPEGTKTEPQYLHRLKLHYGLSSVVVEHSGSTDPEKIVRYALSKFDGKDEWDRVYCVFDGDVVGNLGKALGLLRNSAPAKEGKLFAILSVPCIEFWFLLHFTYTSRAYTRMANKSPCDAVQDDLNKHLEYKKNDKLIFDKLHPHLEKALAHGERLIKEKAVTGGVPNPITHMHELVSYLLSVRKRVAQ